MSNKNCIIIHGCPSDEEAAKDPSARTYDKHWLPWTKRELNAQGVITETPLMPEPWAPVYDKFKQEFEKYEVNEDTVLIGHSCGCNFLVRWLGDTKRKINKLILVAPWKIANDASDSEKAFYDHSIDRTIADRVGEIVFFTSDNEREDGKKGLAMYHEALGGKVVNLPTHGHYILRDMGTEEFPELLEIVLA